MTVAFKSESLERAQARSAAHGLLAACFHYPSQEVCTVLSNAQTWDGWPEALGSADDALPGHLAAIRRQVQSAESLQPPREEFHRLFGHVVRGACPLYELEYGRGEILQKASELADIAGFYSAFGLEITAGGDRVDYVATQCEFLSILAIREAHAIETQDEPLLEISRDAQRSFLEDHLGRWLPSLARRIQEADPSGFYGAVSHFAAAFIASECETFDVNLGPRFLELRPSDPANELDMRCGVDESCIGCSPDSGGAGADTLSE